MAFPWLVLLKTNFVISCVWNLWEQRLWITGSLSWCWQMSTKNTLNKSLYEKRWTVWLDKMLLWTVCLFISYLFIFLSKWQYSTITVKRLIGLHKEEQPWAPLGLSCPSSVLMAVLCWIATVEPVSCVESNSLSILLHPGLEVDRQPHQLLATCLPVLDSPGARQPGEQSPRRAPLKAGCWEPA